MLRHFRVSMNYKSLNSFGPPELPSRMQGSLQLDRSPDLQAFLQANAIEQGVKAKLSAIDKGLVLKTLLIVLPIATWIVSVAGGLYTVYSSSDCQGTNFSKYTRAFLYTSYAYACVNLCMNTSINQSIAFLIRHPLLSFGVYCAQAIIISAFLVAMLVLLILVWKSACPTVTLKIKERLA